jgi:hypothetical protein
MIRTYSICEEEFKALIVSEKEEELLIILPYRVSSETMKKVVTKFQVFFNKDFGDWTVTFVGPFNPMFGTIQRMFKLIETQETELRRKRIDL